MKEFTYGQISLAFLFISIISGFIVGYQFEVALPFVSVVSIDSILPYGWFWRSLHFWSSQAYVILLCFHIYDLKDITRQKDSKKLKIHWCIIATTLPLSIFVLFSGYVLRFDATGQAAGAISEHLLLKLPVIGETLNSLLLDISKQGLNRVYIAHIFIGFICWLLATWYHLGRVKIYKRSFLFALFFCIIFCAFIKAPIESLSINTHLIKGPWFFLGIQELLRYFDPIIAGFVFPLIPILVTILIPWFKEKKYLYLLFLFWGISYLIVSTISILRNS